MAEIIDFTTRERYISDDDPTLWRAQYNYNQTLSHIDALKEWIQEFSEDCVEDPTVNVIAIQIKQLRREEQIELAEANEELKRLYQDLERYNVEWERLNQMRKGATDGEIPLIQAEF